MQINCNILILIDYDIAFTSSQKNMLCDKIATNQHFIHHELWSDDYQYTFIFYVEGTEREYESVQSSLNIKMNEYRIFLEEEKKWIEYVERGPRKVKKEKNVKKKNRECS